MRRCFTSMHHWATGLLRVACCFAARLPINKAFTAISSKSATRRTEEGYADGANVEGVSLRDACGRDRACARRSSGRRRGQARSVAAAESDGEALASARAAAAHGLAQRRLLAPPLLCCDRLAAPRDEARRQSVALRAVLHLDSTARRRQDDLPPGPAVA